MRNVLVLAALLTLVLPATAGAKGVSSLEICGAEGCTQRFSALPHGMLMSMTDTVAPAAGAPRYTVRAVIVEPGRKEPVGGFQLTYVPSAGVVQHDDGQWTKLEAADSTLLRKLTADLPPLPPDVAAPTKPKPAPATVEGSGFPVIPLVVAVTLAVVIASPWLLRRGRGLRAAGA